MKRANPANAKSELKEVIDSFRGSFLFVGLFSAFINILMLVPILYMLQVYDRVLASRSEETLLMLSLIVAWLFITMGLLEFARSRVLVRLGSKMDDRLNTRIYSTMLNAALRNPAQASSQALNDLTAVRQFMTGNGVFAFFDSPWIFIYVAVMFLFHAYFGWLAVFAAIILLLLALANELSTKSLMKQANVQNVQSNQNVALQLRNAEVIHAMGMEKSMRERWLGGHLQFLQRQSDASDRAGVWMNFSKTFRMMFQSAAIGLGGWLAINNEITAGMLIAGSILLGRALAPLDQMIGAWKQFGSARVSYGRLTELLNAFPETARKTTLPPPKGDIVFEAATVVPPGSTQAVLKAINFNIDAGDSLVVLGASASGKSSMLRALLGVWPTVAGKVRIDGAEVAHWNRDELGAHIGYLPQDVELFEGTIAENISRFGEATSEKVIAAAQLAGVDQMIRKLPEGYDTKIGAGGVSLSGGQRQRVGLARAVYDTPPIIILDEPNASLDELGELALVQACEKLNKLGSTLILVTHRQGILKIATKLLILREGQVQVFGPRDEVLKQLAQANAQAKPSAAQQKIQKPVARPPQNAVVNMPGVS
ncbi:MAG: type I secretion system permease/ATPase [bacterium]